MKALLHALRRRLAAWKGWRTAIGATGIVAAVMLGTLVVRIALWSNLTYRGHGASYTIVDIPEGTGAAGALQILEAHGIIRPFPLALFFLRLTGRDSGIQAGEYSFSRPMTPGEVFAKLTSGDVYYHRVTILEGMRSDEVFDQFVRSGFGGEEEFFAAFADSSAVADIDPEAVDLEGYLFPDTYSLQRNTTPQAIVAMMVSRFREVFETSWVEKARGRKLTVRQAVTLASLIERETSDSGENPIVSSVFHNRLRQGMRLQCDPTVIYALAMRNAWDGNIRKNDLRIDSRYNTYRYSGLPPGPIGNPGASALRAAVEPADTSFLYFVSMNTGRHHFSSRLSEHNQAVWEYQKKPYRLRLRSRPASPRRGN